MTQLASAEERARKEVTDLEQRAAQLRDELQGARDSTPALAEAIRDDDAKDYARAIAKYNEAIKLDPGDATIQDLKSYSQFKAGDSKGAIDTISRDLELHPAYDRGYFDKARYQCAQRASDAAFQTIKDALEKRGDKVRSDLRNALKDGEFDRLCADIRGKLLQLVR
jgi:tetratricopeptide (TPR) repeat protein